MEKSADAFRTIGEMAETLGVRTHILRYWEEQFPMLKPLKRAGGRRHYRPEDVALLHDINRLLNQEGYTIKGARKYLSSGARADVVVAEHDEVIVRDSQQSMASDVPTFPAVDMAGLRAIRDRLAAALAAA